MPGLAGHVPVCLKGHLKSGLDAWQWPARMMRRWWRQVDARAGGRWRSKWQRCKLLLCLQAGLITSNLRGYQMARPARFSDLPLEVAACIATKLQNRADK